MYPLCPPACASYAAVRMTKNCTLPQGYRPEKTSLFNRSSFRTAHSLHPRRWTVVGEVPRRPLQPGHPPFEVFWRKHRRKRTKDLNTYRTRLMLGSAVMPFSSLFAGCMYRPIDRKPRRKQYAARSSRLGYAANFTSALHMLCQPWTDCNKVSTNSSGMHPAVSRM